MAKLHLLNLLKEWHQKAMRNNTPQDKYYVQYDKKYSKIKNRYLPQQKGSSSCGLMFIVVEEVFLLLLDHFV